MSKTKPNRPRPAATRPGPGERTDKTGVADREASREHTGTTKPHGLSSPNPRLHPGRTSDASGGEGLRSQSRARPGATSDASRAANERRLPATNATPRAAATSTAPLTAADRLDRSRKLRRGEDPAGRTPSTLRVMATQMGYYDHLRRRPGDVFELRFEEDFSERWMEEVDSDTPLSITLGQDELNRQHDELLAARHLERTTGERPARATSTRREPRTLSEAQRAQQGIQTGRDDVNEDEIPTGLHNPLGAEETYD